MSANVNMDKPLLGDFSGKCNARNLTLLGYGTALLVILTIALTSVAIHATPRNWALNFKWGALFYLPATIAGTIGAIHWKQHGRNARIQDLFKNSQTANFNEKDGSGL